MKEIFEGIDPELLRRFKEYHQKNPEVYNLFKKYALEMAETGRKKYSAWTIINLIRWHHDINSNEDEFKISNDYIAIYARLFAYHHPQYKDFFTFKTMKASGRKFTTKKTVKDCTFKIDEIKYDYHKG